MTERAQLTLFFCIATFIIVVFIAAILVRRHGHTVETKRILDSIEGVRQQQSAEHQALQAETKVVKAWVLRILNRFGFLQGKD